MKYITVKFTEDQIRTLMIALNREIEGYEIYGFGLLSKDAIAFDRRLIGKLNAELVQ